MNYKLMSIDESSVMTGCALFKNGELVDYCVINKKKIKESETRLNEMSRELLNTMKKWKPNSIYIEHPQGGGGNVLTVSLLSEIIGVARAYAVEHNCEFVEVVPSHWRKMLGFKQGGGKKRAELKAMSIEYVKNAYGIDASDDLADAICIGAAIINDVDRKELNDED